MTEMSIGEMSIGELARSTGVNVETVRYYERRGLLAPPSRTRAGYRRFDPEAARQVRFIKRAQGLGFTLKEIQDLLTLRADPDTTCADVKHRAQVKIKDIDSKLELLTAIRQTLSELVDICDGGQGTGRCPILNSLEDCRCCDTGRGADPQPTGSEL
jgi:Hg(II)-responsive transcriptional regulator